MLRVVLEYEIKDILPYAIDKIVYRKKPRFLVRRFERGEFYGGRNNENDGVIGKQLMNKILRLVVLDGERGKCLGADKFRRL